eukprot:scaffold787_cov113-Amphora_coffeaeformis.AAC.5
MWHIYTYRLQPHKVRGLDAVCRSVLNDASQIVAVPSAMGGMLLRDDRKSNLNNFMDLILTSSESLYKTISNYNSNLTNGLPCNVQDV